MHLAIIGAGLAGLSAARALSASHRVTLIEKAENPAGRMATHETEFGGFDDGVQFFSASSEEFKREITQWKKEAWIDAWQARIVRLVNGRALTPARSAVRYVARPGMGALCANLAQGLPLATAQTVTGLQTWGNAKWLLAVQADTVAIPAHAGPFDAVILAMPPEQAAPLLHDVAPQLAAQAASVHLAPCFTLELAFAQALDLGYDGAFIEQSRLAFIAHDNSKPGHRPGERWVAHAALAWSQEHLQDDLPRVRDKLLKAFHEATGSQVQPVYAQALRWPFAQAVQPMAGDCLWDANLRIGLCGDWFAAGLEGEGRVENAWLSGRRLAQQIMQSMPQD
ncbi:FAD-dependent oxidoreductase [Massilia sp. W12]|uniref:NAD(P)/FAD-dependent oxidoreductase n=1 Tax=Massilia sp. W12 TaxID=3126507 RepID=UPI0030CD6528